LKSSRPLSRITSQATSSHYSKCWEAGVLKVLLLHVCLYQGSLAVLPHQVPQDDVGRLGGPAGTPASLQGCVDVNQFPWRSRLNHACYSKVVLETLDFVCFRNDRASQFIKDWMDSTVTNKIHRHGTEQCLTLMHLCSSIE
jgi:hypothetical protein